MATIRISACVCCVSTLPVALSGLLFDCISFLLYYPHSGRLLFFPLAQQLCCKFHWTPARMQWTIKVQRRDNWQHWAKRPHCHTMGSAECWNVGLNNAIEGWNSTGRLSIKTSSTDRDRRSCLMQKYWYFKGNVKSSRAERPYQKTYIC